MGLKGLRRVQQNRYRAIVHQFYLHHFLEAAGVAEKAGGSDACDKVFVELTGALWRGCGVEGWAFAAADVAVQGELRDHQNLARYRSGIEVHFSVLVFEDS